MFVARRAAGVLGYILNLKPYTIWHAVLQCASLRLLSVSGMLCAHSVMRHSLETLALRLRDMLRAGAMKLRSRREAFLVVLGSCVAVAAAFYGVLVLLWT